MCSGDDLDKYIKEETFEKYRNCHCERSEAISVLQEIQ
jgi:hypothetical protein